MATRLLYFDKPQGIGLVNFADTVEQEKWSVLQRGLGRTCTCDAMTGMVKRAARISGAELCGNQGTTLQTCKKTLWLSSLISHAQKLGVELCVTGNMCIGQSSEPLASCLSPEMLGLFKNTNIATVGDLTSWDANEGEYVWATRRLPGEFEEVIQTLPWNPPQSRQAMRLVLE